MSLVAPFPALRPASGRAEEVIAPPYDVMNRQEAKALARGRPLSFLHVSRPEIDLPDSVGIHDEAVYEQANLAMARFRRDEVLVQDDAPAYYLVRVEWKGRSQTGVAAAVSIGAYNAGRVKKHENTRPDKETDRVRHLIAVGAHTGPVMMFCRDSSRVSDLLERAAQAPPEHVSPGPNDTRHTVWRIAEPGFAAEFTEAVEDLGSLYIADGHHRSAAAARAAAQGHGDRFLGVVFPESELQILDYNRVIRDLGPISRDAFWDAVKARFTVAAAQEPVRPTAPGQFGLFMDGAWRELRLDPRNIPDHPTAGLDAELLETHLLKPVLGIHDIRTDTRVDFVGGIRGAEGLEARVADGWALALTVPPVSMTALRRVADAGLIMPPKSTWFEPKLADGLISLVL